MMRPLVRGVLRLGPQLLADSLKEVEYTCLGSKTWLSRLRTLDLLSVLAIPKGDHSGALDPNQKRDHDPQAECRYLKQAHPRQDFTT
jgi:hypothetical protein